eukprot:Colp12_sorted_trinity150504_noHs@15235
MNREMARYVNTSKKKTTASHQVFVQHVGLAIFGILTFFTYFVDGVATLVMLLNIDRFNAQFGAYLLCRVTGAEPEKCSRGPIQEVMFQALALIFTMLPCIILPIASPFGTNQIKKFFAKRGAAPDTSQTGSVGGHGTIYSTKQLTVVSMKDSMEMSESSEMVKNALYTGEAEGGVKDFS